MKQTKTKKMESNNIKVRDINDLFGRSSLLLIWTLERENKEKRRWGGRRLSKSIRIFMK